MVFEANYTWNRGLHLWREFNVNKPLLPKGYKNYSEYLTTHDFANFVSVPGGPRPLYNGTSPAPGNLVRFTTAVNPADPNAITLITEFGVGVNVMSLNSVSSTNTLNAALAALNALRPDPSKGEVEQLIPVGNSFYHGLVLEFRNRFRQGKNGASVSFRVVYTLSFLTDDGIVNTSDALTAGDFRSERSRSLQDRRHRFAFSATIDTPKRLGLRISPVLRITSSAPFNIGLGGADRNLDDIGNDRPFFNGDLSTLTWRRPGQPIDASILNQFTQPTIGQTGDLPRNSGTGPGQFIFDLSVSREFKLSDKVRLRPVVEFNNVLNKTVFSFGSEFIDFSAFSPTSSAATKQAFLDTFLVPSRTQRPREIRLGVRLDF
jgi:hypothetical protein